MKHRSLVIGFLLLTLPGQLSAASIFDTFYDEAAQTIANTTETDAITQFTISQMKRWGPNGVVITAKDIELSQRNDRKACENKKDTAGADIPALSVGSGPFTCPGMLQAINALVEAEREAQELGNTLISITNGNEMATADEPHRGSNVGQAATAFRRLWTGTGADIAAWPVDTADIAVRDLESALGDEKADLDTIIVKFHFGYFRDKKEADANLQDVGPKTAVALQEIADILGIAGNKTKTGDFATPVLKTPNVSLWARKDDLGLEWTYPTHIERFDIKPAWDYPTRAKGGEYLAYPYTYKGDYKPTKADGILTPLCARTAGRSGYLCAQMPSAANCSKTAAAPGTITLTQCDAQVQETRGPLQVCSGSVLLYKDLGQDILNLSPATKAKPQEICSPQTKILYPDDIAHHACYISYCMSQSLSGHTLMPLRNTTLINEPAALVNGFTRNDPQLGVYAEINSHSSQIAIPPYLGLDLVQEFERSYCAQNGLPPSALAGYCSYVQARRTDSPLTFFQTTIASGNKEFSSLSDSLDEVSSLAAAAGFQLSLDQSVPVFRNLSASLAQTIQNIANLLNELKSAPITRQLCPWIGAPTDSTTIPVEP